MRLLASLALSSVAFAAALLVCEVGARLLDGYPLLSLRLPAVPVSAAPRARLDPASGGGALPADIDPAWLDATPKPLRRRGDPDLVQQQLAAEGLDVEPFELFRVWNRYFVEQDGCRADSVLRRLPSPLLVFDPPEPIAHPPYRYLPSRVLPDGLPTNRFGWRGPDIPLDKPPQTVRLAFVGASTTVGLHGLPFSYPEYIAHWLNLWAERAGLTVRFDGINAGREGIKSADIAAVIRQELLPAEPDLVLYYEGANQSLCMRERLDGTRPLRRRMLDFLDRYVFRGTRNYSALLRRLEGVAGRLTSANGSELDKPASDLRWPAGMDEANPDIDGVLPPHLRQIRDDLDSARVPLAQSGGELAIASFEYLVSDGLQLDPQRHMAIYRYLNDLCWPFRYADLRRDVDVNNRALQRYAESRGLPFIDVAGAFPPDPDLFYDAVHLNADGTRLHAWIVFRALLPIIRSHLASNAWPRPDRGPNPAELAIAAGRPYKLSCADQRQ